MERGARPISGAAPWIRCGSDRVTFEVIARPGAARRGFVRIDARGLTVALNSPPEKGKANDELIELLARTLKLPRAALAIVRGTSSRHKTVQISSAAPERVAAALARLAGGAG